MTAAGRPIVLVGNRMLGIMAVAVAVVGVLPVAEGFGPARMAVAAVAAVVAALLLVRRIELGPHEVGWRTVVRRRRCPRAELTEVRLDHRFLRFRPGGGRLVRIEVPAELRPEVRQWADGDRRTAPPPG